MKRLFLLITILFCVRANAAMLTVSLSELNPVVGESIQVTIAGTSFSTVTALQFNFDFDNSIFLFNPSSSINTSFDAFTNLIAPTLSGIGFGFFPAFGTELYSETFTLTFVLEAISVGQSDFSFSNITAGATNPLGPFAPPVTEFVTANTTQASVLASTSVSSPGTLGLFLIAILLYWRNAVTSREQASRTI